MVKAVFFDVDGTLYDPGRALVPDSARAALEQLKRRGVLRVVCTGRHRGELGSLPLADIDFDGYITLNGQLCHGRDGSLLFDRPLEGEGKRRLLELFRQKSLPLLLMEEDRTYINFVSDRVRRIQQDYSAPVPAVGEYEGGRLYQAVAFLTREEESLLGELPGCKCARWSELAVDIVSAAGGKADGLERYLALHGLRREESMAFGDGENDAEMLSYAGVGVAMGGSHPAVIAAADFVAPSLSDDGIAGALRRLGVI